MINGLSKMKKRLFLLICLILGGIKYGYSQVWSPDQGIRGQAVLGRQLIKAIPWAELCFSDEFHMITFF